MLTECKEKVQKRSFNVITKVIVTLSITFWERSENLFLLAVYPYHPNFLHHSNSMKNRVHLLLISAQIYFRGNCWILTESWTAWDECMDNYTV